MNIIGLLAIPLVPPCLHDCLIHRFLLHSNDSAARFYHVCIRYLKMMLLTLGLTFLALAEGRSLRSSCTTDLTTFCSGLGNRAYADPCDITCNTYIECWNGGVGVKATCPPAAPMFNPTKLVSSIAARPMYTHTHAHVRVTY